MLRQKTLFQSIASLWGHLQRRRQIQFFMLLVMMLLSSMAEMLSIGAVVPFLSALVNPEKVFNHVSARSFIVLFSIDRPQDILFPLTAIFCVAALVAGLFRLALLYAITRFSFMVGADFSIDVYRRTLYQPYSVHSRRNSSEIINGITGKVAMLVGSVLMPLLTLTSSTILLVGVLWMLLLIDPVIALVAGSSFGFLYVITALISRRSLRENSECIARESTRVIKALQEGLGGIRDVLVDGTQEAYCVIYRNADLPLRRAQGRNAFVSASPRYIMEMLGMIMIAVLAYNMAQSEGGVGAALPVLGALALGAQRLLPVLQQGYNALATIFGAEASMRDGLELLAQPMPKQFGDKLAPPLPFTRAIRLEGISFRYSADSAWILRDVNLEIPKGKRVGFVGTTGAGKSTLLDMLMSLLTPSEGVMLIDGQAVGEHNYRNWQAHIAHVPQSIYLSDSSVAENIAFGLPRKEIDPERVRQAAKQAQIDDVIESLPEKYQTTVGERGVRMSGGQRQRIGIARALYKRADVIIFDEATSALDNETENAVMQAIDSLSPDLTILIVAHRTTTLQKCDFIVEIDNGRILRIGSYQEIANDSQA
ncbi:ABC transporter ATP-binding protein [Pusillimonas minor]|uniref:Cyclolysin secretion/processing ATP-binding protein CyaB n=1 Tax=Pusillimonas minor TaxID=2697024 RepID=A0A842HT28_9BURK|nr:ABC transporter ATP-binding protein [Pusillimonas minor]MBC2770570.1 ABC transporter ATP-binding protein [Pusillimonas minor]